MLRQQLGHRRWEKPVLTPTHVLVVTSDPASGEVTAALQVISSIGEVRTAWINRAADVAAHTPQDPKENILGNVLVGRRWGLRFSLLPV